MAKKASEEPTADKQAPIIMALADINDWEIGPTKESDCVLTVKISVANYEDVETIRQLARGRVALRVMPLQFNLSLRAPGCDHPEGLQVSFSDTTRVCLQCGEILEIPLDDQKPEESRD
jgi:hypothetical protein